MLVKLDKRKINIIINELNKVLDDNKILSKEWTKEIIIAFIISNLTKNDTIDLIERIENISISEWN